LKLALNTTTYKWYDSYQTDFQDCIVIVIIWCVSKFHLWILCGIPVICFYIFFLLCCNIINVYFVDLGTFSTGSELYHLYNFYTICINYEYIFIPWILIVIGLIKPLN
jgi:ABC-type uncharacterized transport system permease subunit